MKNWKSKVPLFTRLKFAWKAFWLQSITIENWQPYQVQTNLLNPKRWECDIHDCKHEQALCLSRTDLVLYVEAEGLDHLHVCATHAAKIEGKVKAYGGFDRFGFNNNLKIVQN